MRAQDDNMKIIACAMAALVGLGLLIVWLEPPKMNERREHVLRESLAEAGRARAKGDHYRALEAYTHAAQMASSIDDWRGLLEVACGLERLGNIEGPSVYGFNVIMTAMTAAERQKSAAGMRAVADAFASLGASFASFALSRVRDDWTDEGAGGPVVVRRRPSDDALVQPSGCADHFAPRSAP